MPHPTTPTEVAHALLDGVSRLVMGDPGQIERLVGLYAEATEVRHPMSPVGIPVLRTRDDLRRHFAEGPGRMPAPERFEPVDVIVHVTEDPEVVIAEFAYAVTRDGTTHLIPCVFVLRVREGQIVESRDHADHVAMARAAGRLNALCDELSVNTA